MQLRFLHSAILIISRNRRALTYLTKFFYTKWYTNILECTNIYGIASAINYNKWKLYMITAVRYIRSAVYGVSSKISKELKRNTKKLH